MNVLVWNARGLGSSRAFHELHRLIAGTSSSVLFISEMKVTAKKASWWRSSLHFDGQLVVDSKGASGGLMIFWIDSCVLNVSSYSNGHIDCMIKTNEMWWRFTGFYGNPDTQQRKHSWSLMRRLACSGSMDIPWLLGGDFNEITKRAECCERSKRSWAQMEEFNNTLQYCGVKTIPSDSMFSWYNPRKMKDARLLRLDRFLGNRLLDDVFEFNVVRTLDTHGSDHNPLLLTLTPTDDRPEQGNGYKRFFFEQKWLLDKSFAADLLVNWEVFGGRELHNRLACCQGFLKSWSKDKFNKIEKTLVQLRKKRLNLLKNHTSPTPACIDEVSNTCSKFLGEAARSGLGEAFTEEEVRKAVFKMHLHKAPGLDGFPPFFFQKFWGGIGDGVTADVLQVLNNGVSIRPWNKTLIVLIPKIKKPKEVKDFRPLSLCNTIYKIVAKVIANRLRSVLHLMVDESQSAFILGRLISDNIILGNECMHWIRNKTHGIESFAAAKLDMSKAFDRVE
ncbi:uncharacterized protein LOC131023491 [Salvia miltiorrhiza]|uniref:uncharacterized protein LOC131023491 n=1 Tax=Salvia miltiorrhiza TaxID=226208 RepID=UPI0025AD6107|nr:uncharacterized protein LOC131023491 [Salvia miltiorrhiza]